MGISYLSANLDRKHIAKEDQIMIRFFDYFSDSFRYALYSLKYKLFDSEEGKSFTQLRKYVEDNNVLSSYSEDVGYRNGSILL